MIIQVRLYSFRLLKYGLVIGIALWGITGSISGIAASPHISQPAYLPAAANPKIASLEKADCSSFAGAGFGDSDTNAECGYLIVPENRQNPQSRTIKVAYAILKATSPPALSPHSTPVHTG